MSGRELNFGRFWTSPPVVIRSVESVPVSSWQSHQRGSNEAYCCRKQPGRPRPDSVCVRAPLSIYTHAATASFLYQAPPPESLIDRLNLRYFEICACSTSDRSVCEQQRILSGSPCADICRTALDSDENHFPGAVRGQQAAGRRPSTFIYCGCVLNRRGIVRCTARFQGGRKTRPAVSAERAERSRNCCTYEGVNRIVSILVESSGANLRRSAVWLVMRKRRPR